MKLDYPLPKSVSKAERLRRLRGLVSAEDTLAIVISADPDAMASALALRRLFWRKVRRAVIYHTNEIQRADNLAMIRLLKIEQFHIRQMKPAEITRWAIVDSQPCHIKALCDRRFDIIIDHHPVTGNVMGGFVDIREHYGATSTLMTEYLRAAKIRPSVRLATALFYGIKTDTDNFVRAALPNDVSAFRYLYQFANMNVIKKVESSEMTRETLASYGQAMRRLRLIDDTAFVFMGEVVNPDVLVILADFFMRLAEAKWSVVGGIYDKRLVLIIRNVGFKGDAGTVARKLIAGWEGSAGGHKSAARAEVPLENIGAFSTRAVGGHVLARVRGLKSQGPERAGHRHEL